jgi:predicted DNA-binding transcriptional regulator AlpA
MARPIYNLKDADARPPRDPRALPADALLPAAEVAAFFSVSRMSLWRWVRAGAFPPPVKLGPPLPMGRSGQDTRRSYWRAADVTAFAAARTAEARGA